MNPLHLHLMLNHVPVLGTASASLIMALVTAGLMLQTTNLGEKVRHTEIRGDTSTEQASIRRHGWGIEK